MWPMLEKKNPFIKSSSSFLRRRIKKISFSQSQNEIFVFFNKKALNFFPLIKIGLPFPEKIAKGASILTYHHARKVETKENSGLVLSWGQLGESKPQA